MDYSAIIDRLEDAIRQYRIEYQQFFNGEINVPPERRGDKIRQQLNTLVGASQMSAVERFKLSGLESRYNSQRELFQRRLREMQAARRIVTPTAAPGKTVVDLGSKGDSGGVADLYNAIYGDGNSKIGLEQFNDYLLGQAKKVRQRTGCESVRFTVRDEDGKPKLKARPLKSGE